MIHSDFFINSISPHCTTIKSPPSIQHSEIKTKSGTEALMQLSLLDLCQAAVLALWRLSLPSDMAAPIKYTMKRHRQKSHYENTDETIKSQAP